MEHALHLAAKHFVEGVNPTPVSKLAKKFKAAMQTATDEGTELDIDALEKEISGIDFEAMGGDDDDETDFDMADTVGKALALVAQVRDGFTVELTKALTSAYHRFADPRKLSPSSINAAPKLTYPHLSSSDGSVHVGHHCLKCSSECFACERSVNVTYS